MIKEYTKKEIAQLEDIGDGIEAKIRKDKEYAIKIFTNRFGNNKKKILEELKKYNFPFLTNPIDYVMIDKVVEGYYMEYFNGFALDNPNVQISDKLTILRKIKEYIETLHKHDFIVGDLYTPNILVNGNNIKICDVDSFVRPGEIPKIRRYSGTLYFMLKRKKDYIADINLDTFMFNLLTLFFLNNYSHKQAFKISTIYHKPQNEHEQLIQSAIFNKELLDEYLLDNIDLQKKTKLFI